MPLCFLVSFTSQKIRTILMYMFYTEHTNLKIKLRAISNTGHLRPHALRPSVLLPSPPPVGAPSLLCYNAGVAPLLSSGVGVAPASGAPPLGLSATPL